MFKIPEKIKIGGMVYAVEITDKMASDRAGEINFQKLAIRISSDLTPERQTRVFMHEIVHGLRDNLGYDIEDDEKEVDELAGAFYALIIDNPGLFGQKEKENNKSFTINGYAGEKKVIEE